MGVATGAVEPLTELDGARGEADHVWPHALPDEEHVLFTVWDDPRVLAVVSLATGEWHRIEQTAGAVQPHYLDSGHLVFFRDGGLFAAPFSLSRLAIEGPIVNAPEQDFVGTSIAGLDLGYFAASRSGSLVFVPGSADFDQNELVRVHRTGAAEPISETGHYRYRPTVSPDGARVAIVLNGLFLYDLERRSLTRLTPRGISPVWSADGRRVYFSWFPRGDAELFVARADGSGTSESLGERPFDQYLRDASPDGRFLVFDENHPETGWDLHVMQLESGNESFAFAATPANEQYGAFSPDGRFLAYSSDETGREEIYVRAISGEGGKVSVSIDGGTRPRWSTSGSEIFYMRGTTMISVPVELDPTFRPGTPEPLFDGNYAERFDVFPDGEHFLMITLADVDLRELEVVVNWSTELAELVPAQ